MPETSTATRIPDTHLDRADALVGRMEGSLELVAAPAASRAAVIRIALDLGLRELERRYPEIEGA